jgi:hypothetical protein
MLGKDEFHLYKYGLVHIHFPQVYHYPKFVNWFALKYFENNREALSSDESIFVCKINPKSIRQMLKFIMS